jgi:quercetin dioxygenase-like cupin family protein
VDSPIIAKEKTMGFQVYDYRKDVRNVLVTPQLRSRFLRAEPGQLLAPHTHDLGHEVFLVLQGRAIFEIDGEKEELGPGQMCIALAGQMHSIQVISVEPMIMYLSVTPHIQPTHTMWTQDGQRLPHRFVPSSAYDVETDTATPLPELVDRFVQATQAVSKAARAAATREAKLAESLKQAIASGDEDAASDARNAMWEAQLPIYQLAQELASLWNDLAPRAGKTQ